MRVLLIGASGVFGRRLAEQLAREPGIELILAGRTRSRLQRLGAALAGEPEIAALDRNLITAGELRTLRAAIVIDAAGPFQTARTTLIDAAIEAGCHYLDLADGRAFVAGIARFDAAARARGIAVLSGASTTPALSHAVLDHLTDGWTEIDAIRVGISSGSRAPRGPAVVRSVLSYVGRPVRIFRDGAWTTAPGWGLTHGRTFPGLGKRLLSLCETPDLDLLVERYRPRLAAEFFAGLELGLLHRGLALAGLMVRLGWLESLAPLADGMRFLARICDPLGSDRGGMIVEALGRNADDVPLVARWTLESQPGRGPYVPTLAALLLVRRLRDGSLDFRGAGASVGLLKLAEFEGDFRRHGFDTGITRSGLPDPPFVEALGPCFFALPEVTQSIHQPEPVLLFGGQAEVDGAETWAARRLARLFGFPEAARAVPLRVAIEAAADGSERWSRVYPTRVMRSVMSRPDPVDRSLEERFGGFRFRLRLDTDQDGLAMVPTAAWWHRIPLPLWLLPRIAARERADGERHLFDVAISLPLIGRLVRYRGYLVVR